LSLFSLWHSHEHLSGALHHAAHSLNSSIMIPSS
jgi:hypothetical protein